MCYSKVLNIDLGYDLLLQVSDSPYYYHTGIIK
jgi:hypothetical protein